MVDIERIPVEIRWRLATRMLTYLPFAYQHALRDRVGEDYEALENGIFSGLARESGLIALAFQLPRRNAPEIAATLATISGIMYGPSLEWSATPDAEDRSVMRVSGCPSADLAKEFGFPCTEACNACRSYMSTLVGHLNSEYRLVYPAPETSQADRCEMTVCRR
jgi:hypothetical protein